MTNHPSSETSPTRPSDWRLDGDVRPARARTATLPRVQSIGRAASILFAIAESQSGLTAAQVRERTGLPRQATYHILQSLQVLGLLRRSADNAYVLGLRVGDLMDGFKRQISCPEELRRLVGRIAYRTGETSYASGWYDGDLVTLVVESGTNAVLASPGTRHLSGYVHARASGKLLLALSNEATKQAYFAENKLGKLTENTLNDEPSLRSEFDEILRQGYALDREEYALGLQCLAVPVKISDEVFALCVSAPSERFAQTLDSIKFSVFEEIDAFLNPKP